MRIQEMRSGLAHLRKKDEPVERKQQIIEDEPDERSVGRSAASELDEPRWSVVSFSQHEAGGLNYRQASRLIDELERYGITGLCIITDEAAARLPR